MSLSYSKRATQYAREAVSGKRKVPDLVRAACARHLSNLAKSKDAAYPYRFDHRAGNKICDFAERMVHIKGKWAARDANGEIPSIKLELWQCFMLAVLFGWLRKSDNLRRFREIYAEIPRKNAKSTIGAIIGLYMAFADGPTDETGHVQGEPGAEVFAGATSEDQANAVFKPAWMMVKNNPEFREHFGLFLGGTEKNPGPIFQESSGSVFKTMLGKPGDGDSPHCGINDEYHEQTTSIQYDAMKTGMGSRSQPMRVVITTAGVDTSGPCYDKHLDAEKILNGTMEDDETFCLIYGIPLDADWQNFDNWKIANPNFEVSVSEDFLRGQLRGALQSPSQQNITLTKHLGQWRSSGAAWLNMASWDKCKDETLQLSEFNGRDCWLAADLASLIDFASLAYLFRAPAGLPFQWALFCKHYLPEATIELPQNNHYRKWRDAGWVIQAGESRTDLKRIEDDIRDAAKMFNVREFGFDKKEANYLVTNLEQDMSFDCVDIPQAAAHISAPMKELEALIQSAGIRHQGDPVLTWMAGNVVKKQARSGGPIKSYYPTKQSAANKIDGMVAAIMALSLGMVAEDRTPGIFFIGRSR